MSIAGKIVPLRESRAEPAARRETTVMNRIASRCKSKYDEFMKVAFRQNTQSEIEMQMKTSTLLILVRPHDLAHDGFAGQQTGSRFWTRKPHAMAVMARPRGPRRPRRRLA
jgi:hypothetical protein